MSDFKSIVLLGALLLTISSCGSPRPMSEDDVSDIAHDVAVDVTSSQSARISELETRVEELEAQLESICGRITC